MQILRYAEEPEFLETPGSPKTLAWAIDEEDILRDVVSSAYLGRPVAWHSLFSEGRDSRLHTRAGQNLEDVWQAHAKLAEEVSICNVIHFCATAAAITAAACIHHAFAHEHMTGPCQPYALSLAAARFGC